MSRPGGHGPPSRDLRFSDVQAWVAELSAKRGPVIVATAYSVLARILDDAVRDRSLVINPARGVKLPKRPPRRNVYLTVGQLNRLADEAGRYKSLVLLLGVGGLRWGEAAALRVSDIDFLRRRIELHRNAVTVGRQTYVGTLKSNKNRTVALPPIVTDALRRPPRARAETNCCGRHRPAPISRRQRPASPGCPVQWPAARKPTRRSRKRTSAHRGIAGHQRRGEREGGAADAGARQRSDDARRVRRSVRVRPRYGRGPARKRAQNVLTGRQLARVFGAENASTSAIYTEIG